jgi:chemotaxis protein methyltransferase CheR
MHATSPLSSRLLQQVSERIEERIGLHFPPSRFADLERGLARVAGESGFPNAAAYVESLLRRNLHAGDLDALAGSLTISETHFFRDPGVCEFLESSFLPGLIGARRESGRRLRIWSAGCATGEEPYTLAILLHRLIPDIADWEITILGTDINPAVLARAASGIYSEWSFRDTPAWVRPRYFVPHLPRRYKILPEIRRMVTFARLNLAAEDYPSILSNTHEMDLIVCRNVLLYFAVPRIPSVVGRFHMALVGDGRLVLGAVEASQIPLSGFAHLPARGVALYRKAESGTRDGDPAPPAPARPAFRPPPPKVPPPAPAPIEAAESAMRAARQLANSGELAEALTWCERAVALAKFDPAAHFLHASILRELGRDEDAIQSLRRVLFLDPEHVFAHFSSANLHRRCGRDAEAGRHFAHAGRLLSGRDERDELPESGGLTVGQLNSILTGSVEMAKNRGGQRP